MNLKFNRLYIDSNCNLDIIERIPSNYYIYKYDLREESEDEFQSSPNKKYSYVEVKLKGFPNYNETIKALLRMLVSLEDELKLINDYNEALEFEYEYKDTKEYKNYIEYISFRKEIKDKVKQDFTNNGY